MTHSGYDKTLFYSENDLKILLEAIFMKTFWLKNKRIDWL